MEWLYQWVPVIICVVLFVYPFGALANESYKAICKKNSVPAGVAVFNYIPFVSYYDTIKYFYNKAPHVIVWSLLSILCIAARIICYALHVAGTLMDPNIMLMSSWATLIGAGLWYLLMAYVAFDTARLTRRGIVTKILAIVLPPIGAYIVSKNVRKHFASLKEELNDEFSGKTKRTGNPNNA